MLLGDDVPNLGQCTDDPTSVSIQVRHLVRAAFLQVDTSGAEPQDAFQADFLLVALMNCRDEELREQALCKSSIRVNNY